MFRKHKPEYLIISIFIAINLIIHLIADLNAGYHGDELLYIESGRHLAAGYMDFSPMIALLASIQNLFHSTSLIVNHLFLHLATAMIFLVCGIITIELGGRWMAVIVTLSCILFSPGFGASQSLFLPDVFDQLAWVICLLLVVKFCNIPDNKYLVLTAIAAAAGFLTKYTIAFFIGGLVISIFLFNLDLLRRKALWISLSVFLLMISANVIWQITNGFPVIGHFSELYKTQLSELSLTGELKSMFLYLNPLTIVFWAAGLLLVPFFKSYKKYRLMTYTLLFSFIFLLLARAKSYYFFPVILGVLPLGSVATEKFLNQKRWILSTYLSLTCLAGLYLLPHGIPVIPLEKYIKLYHLTKNRGNRIPLPFENFYSKTLYNKMLETVSSEFHKLSPQEQKDCRIWGRHYSHAGAVNLMGKKYGLPQAFSFHSSFHNWVPDFDKSITIIAISDANLTEDYWHRYFDEVTEVGSVENLYTSDYKWFTNHIYLCRNLKYDSEGLKEKFRDEIF